MLIVAEAVLSYYKRVVVVAVAMAVVVDDSSLPYHDKGLLLCGNKALTRLQDSSPALKKHFF